MTEAERIKEKDHWINWLSKRIELDHVQKDLVRFALGELQSHNECLQEQVEVLTDRLRLADKNCELLRGHRNDLESELKAAQELNRELADQMQLILNVFREDMLKVDIKHYESLINKANYV